MSNARRRRQSCASRPAPVALTTNTDDGTERYAGTLVLDISADADGRFTIGFNPDRRETFLYDGGPGLGTLIPIARLEPAVVVVDPSCCTGPTCQAISTQDCLNQGGVLVNACGGNCNRNGANDACEIANGTSSDCNGNGVPDDCDIAAGTTSDCNGNATPDECDIASGTSGDCNDNAIPDDCDLTTGISIDCNTNAIPDDCDIASDAPEIVDRNRRAEHL